MVLWIRSEWVDGEHIRRMSIGWLGLLYEVVHLGVVCDGDSVRVMASKDLIKGTCV